MKKLIKKIISCLLLILGLYCISCCQLNSDPYDSVVYGDFIYSTYYKGFNGEEGDISIIGLSEEGKKKETIVFPNYLDGHRVVAFGATFALLDSGPIEITNAKKIYFCKPLSEKGYECITSLKYNPNNHCEIYICGATYPYLVYIEHLLAMNSVIYIDPSLIEMGLFSPPGAIPYDLYDFKISTVSYYTDEDTCYFVDYVINDKVSVIPPDPYKEGYIFGGWYEDLDYSKKWDFNNIINPIPRIKDTEENSKNKNEDDFDYDYEPVKVYAKWNKIEE